MYLLLAFVYRQIEQHIPPCIPFSINKNISISVKRSNFTSFFLKATSHGNPGTGRNFAGSNLYILRHIFLKFSNTTANNNILLWTYKP